MPTYQYKCEKCGQELEANVPIEERNNVEHCGQPMTRLLSAPRFQLKGGGWYVTDFKDNSAPASKDADPEQ